MGSSSKKKKQKKADFQKIKLKVGKKIPKGNVVDTTFKAKKIIIKEQLQNVVGQQDGRIKQDIKEYLSKLKHNSMTVRGEAMKNLKESLTAFPELIQSNLHALVECLLEVITDPYTPLRKLNISVLKLVFCNIQSVQVIPFFPMIVAHLRCGMTHIIYEVQEDSLSVIDLLIDFFPQHLKYFSKHLLQDFLNQISNQTKTFSARASSLHKNRDKRVLAADPSRKVTSLAWYLQVCHRLQNVLKTILGCTDSGPYLNNKNSLRITWVPGKPLFASNCSSNSIAVNNAAKKCDNPSDFFEDKDKLFSMLSSLMPLLFGIWIEAKNLASNESLEVYQCIAEIVHLLWKIIGKWQVAEKDLTLESWFIKQFGNLFISHCMTSFPYLGHFKLEKNTNPDEVNISQNALRLNLLLCDILTCVTSVNRKNEHLNIAKHYVVDILNSCRKKPLSPGNAEVIVDVLRKLFLVDNYKSNQSLLKPAVVAFQKCSRGSHCYMHFLGLLRDIVEEPKYKHLFNQPSLSSWLAQIPIDLVQTGAIPWELIDMMRLVAPRHQAEFLSNVQLNLPIALESLGSMCISDGDCCEARRILIDMLYWVPQIETSLLSLIARLSIMEMLDLPLICHALQVLHSRYQKDDLASWPNGRCAYISFLLSMSFGSLKVELLELQNVPSEGYAWFTSVLRCGHDRQFRIMLDSKTRLLHQNNLMKIGLNSLNAVCADSSLHQVLEGFLIQILDQHAVLPLRCVQTLLVLSCNTWKDTDMPKNLHLPSLELSMLFLEILVNDEEIQTFSLPVVDSIMKQSSLSFLICHRLLQLASADLSDKSMRILGEMTLLVIKSCEQEHVKLLEDVLKCIKNAGEESVSTSLWFVTSLYEISCKNVSMVKK